MLFTDCANVPDMSAWRNLEKNSVKLKACSLTYILKACSTIAGMRYIIGTMTMMDKLMSRIRAGRFLPFIFDFITLCTGLKM